MLERKLLKIGRNFSLEEKEEMLVLRRCKSRVERVVVVGRRSAGWKGRRYSTAKRMEGQTVRVGSTRRIDDDRGSRRIDDEGSTMAGGEVEGGIMVERSYARTMGHRVQCGGGRFVW